jgi:hypothetical protein
MAGSRVYYGPDLQRATIIRTRRPATDPTGPWVYDLHLDRGGDLVDIAASEVESMGPYDGLERLAPRWRKLGNRAGDAVRAVARAEWAVSRYGPPGAEQAELVGTDDIPVPTLDDDLDALSLMGAYRAEVDRDEQELIAAARARGVSWEQIGLVLGSPPGIAAQRAQDRWKALTDRA